MSIENPNVVDMVSVDRSTGNAALIITDHLEWVEPAEDHLLKLQEKINTYLRFMESGEIYESFPKARGKDLVIKVVGLHDLSEAAAEFFETAKPIIRDAGFELVFERFKE